jgi:BlaI family penicillinase repressor
VQKSQGSRRRATIPDAELAVLKVLWERGQATIRQITGLVYPAGEVAHYATVQKLLERLRKRKYVSRRRLGRAHVYVPTKLREDLIREHLHEAADRFCEGSFSPLLSQLVDATDLSHEDLKTLRELVDRLERGGGT